MQCRENSPALEHPSPRASMRIVLSMVLCKTRPLLGGSASVLWCVILAACVMPHRHAHVAVMIVISQCARIETRAQTVSSPTRPSAYGRGWAAGHPARASLPTRAAALKLITSLRSHELRVCGTAPRGLIPRLGLPPLGAGRKEPRASSSLSFFHSARLRAQFCTAS